MKENVLLLIDKSKFVLFFTLICLYMVLLTKYDGYVMIRATLGVIGMSDFKFEFINNSSINQSQEMSNFVNHEFVWDDKIGKYILDGYGAWIVNIDPNSSVNFFEYVEKSNFLSSYLENGANLVIGPAGPAENGVCYYNLKGVFIKNYKEYNEFLDTRKKQEKYNDNVFDINFNIKGLSDMFLTAEDIVELYIKLSNFGASISDKEEFLLLCRVIENLENEIIDHLSYDEVYKIIGDLDIALKSDNLNCEIERCNLEKMMNRLDQKLYFSLLNEESAVKSDKVNVLIEIGNKLAGDYNMLLKSLVVPFDNTIVYVYDDYKDRLINDCSVSEFLGVRNGLIESNDSSSVSYLSRMKFVFELDKEFKDKLYKERFGKKSNIKVKTNY